MKNIERVFCSGCGQDIEYENLGDRIRVEHHDGCTPGVRFPDTVVKVGRSDGDIQPEVPCTAARSSSSGRSKVTTCPTSDSASDSSLGSSSSPSSTTTQGDSDVRLG